MLVVLSSSGQGPGEWYRYFKTQLQQKTNDGYIHHIKFIVLQGRCIVGTTFQTLWEQWFEKHLSAATTVIKTIHLSSNLSTSDHGRLCGRQQWWFLYKAKSRNSFETKQATRALCHSVKVLKTIVSRICFMCRTVYSNTHLKMLWGCAGNNLSMRELCVKLLGCIVCIAQYVKIKCIGSFVIFVENSRWRWKLQLY